ncbi:flagellar hook-length control protein FliK [Aquamicrobium zhengzhouense]|uniref:Flagellar hook-length control protein FliK n=1 Tax=Aquamicrobium zhengzhouense TaxID=2781738 RepID=A0ABS0SA97_9HYPH|nr:flagellar hook-length control protein FliK [Aquamicrobium zhengzhouense]MBI1619734.1 flagellar hook-length control protein FliK [Aquamicrobium zhengzhouense]
MTMNIAMPILPSAPAGQGSSRGKQDPADSGGFDELVTARADERSARTADDKPVQIEPEELASTGGDDAASLNDAAGEDDTTSLEAALAILLPKEAEHPLKKAHRADSRDTAERLQISGATSSEGQNEAPAVVDPTRTLRNALANVIPAAETAIEPQPQSVAASALAMAPTSLRRENSKPALEQVAPKEVSRTSSHTGSPQPIEIGRGQTKLDVVASEAQRSGGTAEPNLPPRALASDTPQTGPEKGTANLQGPTSQFAGRVDVVGFNTAPAPSPVSMLSMTSAALVADIEAEPTWRSAQTDPALASTVRTAANSGGLSTLKIQLTPIELGTVTARLTSNGSQLTVELQVETSDARQRLTSEHDAIVKALRAVGFDVDKVTIQQSSTASNSSQNEQSGTGSRSAETFDEAAQRGERSGNQRQQGSGEERESAAPGDTTPTVQSSDLYI